MVRTRGGVGLVTVSLCLAAPLALGVAARLPTAGLAGADALISRPDIGIDPSTLPAVNVDPSVRRLGARIAPMTAGAMARDFAADLEIEALALRHADREVAKTAAAGTRLAGLLRAIDASRENGQITLAVYTFDSITVVPVYDTANAQAGPRFGLEVRGSINQATYAASSMDHPLHEESVRCDRTFALLERNGAFLIAADYPIRSG
jgi:hypothetical protein